MPWCNTCDRFLSPSTVTTDGTCPSCGRVVDPGRAHAPEPVEHPITTTAAGGSAEPPPADADDGLPPIPWHLKLLVAALALYLGWRAYQGVEWLAHVF